MLKKILLLVPVLLVFSIPSSVAILMETELANRGITWNNREMNSSGILWTNLALSDVFVAEELMLYWNWPPHISLSQVHLEQIHTSLDTQVSSIKERASTQWPIPIKVSVNKFFLPQNPIVKDSLSGHLLPELKLRNATSTIFLEKSDDIITIFGSLELSVTKEPLKLSGPVEFKISQDGFFEFNNLLLSSEFLPKMPSLKIKGNLNKSNFSAKVLLGELSTTVNGSYSTAPLSVQGSLSMNWQLAELINTFRIPERKRIKVDGGASLTGNFSYPDTELSLKINDLTWTITDGDLFDPNTFYRGVIPYTPLNSEEIRLVGPASQSWVSFDQQGWMPAATVAAEDSAFFRHKGYDPEGLQIALEELLNGEHNPRGGSTLTQQLAKNLFLDGDKHLTRKLRELVYALELERVLSKKEILEIYLNVVEFGPEIYGIKQAANQYFVKPPAALTLKESAYLASVLPAPTHHFKARQDEKRLSLWKVNNILTNMKDGKSITQTQLNNARKQSLRIIVPK
ncbi:MAG: hypothetical protein CMK59_15395 [Proteobacteria bacterium]|nr:hypothetical protein [Pseudomonadota bacterium]